MNRPLFIHPCECCDHGIFRGRSIPPAARAHGERYRCDACRIRCTNRECRLRDRVVYAPPVAS